MPPSVSRDRDLHNTQINVLLYLIAPEPKHKPAFRFQRPVHQPIAAPIAFDLSMPEFNVGLMFELALMPVLAMPKLTICEYRDSQGSKSEVRLPEDSPVVLAIPETCAPQSFAKANFYR